MLPSASQIVYSPLRRRKWMSRRDSLLANQSQALRYSWRVTRGIVYGDRTASRPRLPIVKWPGGKRWLWPTLSSLLPQRFNHYFEPFLGGGAVFWALQPKRAILSDINPELINAYVQIRDNPRGLARALSQLRISRGSFAQLRRLHPTDPLDRAVRLLYLNRTAFNGIYRVNRRGEFNVPFGCKKGTRLPDAVTLETASRHLQGIELMAADFSHALEHVRRDDLVFCDPPYTVRHDNNGFLRYNESLFSWDDQQRLAAEAHRLLQRGAFVIVTNAHTSHIRKLYGTRFLALTVRRQSRVSARVDSRSAVNEYMFVGVPRGA